MILKTMINAERDVDERLCGVNEMTFEESLSYQNQMLRYYSTYQYDSGPYEEEYYPSEEDDSSEETNHRTKTMNRTTIITTAVVIIILLKKRRYTASKDAIYGE